MNQFTLNFIILTSAFMFVFGMVGPKFLPHHNSKEIREFTTPTATYLVILAIYIYIAQ